MQNGEANYRFFIVGECGLWIGFNAPLKIKRDEVIWNKVTKKQYEKNERVKKRLKKGFLPLNLKAEGLEVKPSFLPLNLNFSRI